MHVSRHLCLLTMLTGGFASLALAADKESQLDSAVVVYESPGRTSFEEIGDGHWSVGLTQPTSETLSQKEDFMLWEVVGERLVDCSDRQYRCVSSWHRTYAIPRRRLSPTDIYAKDGVTFKVEKCLRGDAAICQVALIGGYCVSARNERSTPEPREEQPAPWLYVTYFLYNEDFGITAMGVTQSPAATVDEKLAIASQSILRGSKGLLRE